MGYSYYDRLSTQYHFEKPNDKRALNLMNAAAIAVMRSLPDLCIGYGVSDEFSFVFHKTTNLFERRRAKLVSTVVSTFTASYIHLWETQFGDNKLDVQWLPTFDGRAVCYPSTANLRDYMSWRQVDCMYFHFISVLESVVSQFSGHINNLYNTTFWAMVMKGGTSTTAAEVELKGTVAADKNEILFSRFAINYNNEPEMFRKGSVVFRDYALESPNAEREDTQYGTIETINEQLSKTQKEKIRKARNKANVIVDHLDIISDDFWNKRPWILSGKPGKVKEDVSSITN